MRNALLQAHAWMEGSNLVEAYFGPSIIWIIPLPQREIVKEKCFTEQEIHLLGGRRLNRAERMTGDARGKAMSDQDRAMHQMSRPC